jgi:hypothetical protein
VIVSRSHAHRSVAVVVCLLAAAVCALALSAGGASGAGARAARTVVLNENGRLHLTSHHTTHLNLQGTATGSIRGTIYIHLNVTSPTRVSAEVSIYPSNGSLTGVSTASYHASGGHATFSGTLSIIRGSGAYAHAHASALGFSGTIQRSNDATSVHVSGPLSY